MKNDIAGTPRLRAARRGKFAINNSRSGRRARQAQRGTAIVEFALVLPLLLILLFGIVELGFLLYDKTVITSASRAAVRQGVAFGEDSTGTPVYLSAANIGQIAQGGLSTQLIGFGAATPNVTVTNCTSSGSCSAGGCSPGNSLTVTVTYAFQGLLLGAAISPFPAALNNALTLTSSTVMSCE
ncbi:MAG TPA: TadE/TadG family type IV pilus assembly protein [Paraburkholderia sp.]|nr:TadE/TadG family type IV pilus assembly protein [Paraburkholderia sp.]